MILPKYAATAIERINKSGYDCYAVGGCVRDGLRGIAPADWDLCTNATPMAVCEIFADCPCILTGVQHGTVTVLADGYPLEITTYRIEGGYSDARHPDRVEFVSSLEDDLARRDFTINAMAFHPQKGVIDLFGGQTDLGNGCLRCVGDAAQRFREDPLRILRGLRFASCLGFSFEDGTAAALEKEAHRLSLVAQERVQHEWNRLLMGEFVGEVLLAFPSVLTEIIPELRRAKSFDQHSRYHRFDVLEHMIRAAAGAPAILPVRLSLLLHDIGKPHCFVCDEEGNGHFYGHATRGEEIVKSILQRLRYDRRTAEQVAFLVRYHDTPIPLEEKAVKRWLNRFGEEHVRLLLSVKEGDCRALKEEFAAQRINEIDQLRLILDRVVAQEQCFSLKQLAVNGNDLLALGIPAGKQVGETLERLLDAVIEGEIPNEREQLLSLVKNT